MRKAKPPKAAIQAAREQTARDAAAFDAMCAAAKARFVARGGKPPALRLLPPVVSAGLLELRKARRLGVAA
jgi:hypothetical protein